MVGCAKVKPFPHGFFLFTHAQTLHGIIASHFLVWLLNGNKVQVLSWIGIRKDLLQSEIWIRGDFNHFENVLYDIFKFLPR